MKNRQKVFAQDDFPAKLILQVDGSVVTTSNAVTGLLQGSAHAKVSKGTGGTSHVVTITFNKSFAAVPSCTVTSLVANVQFLVVPTVSGVVITTTESDDNTTGKDDADFILCIDGFVNS